MMVDFFRPMITRPRAEPAADLPQLRAERALGLLRAVLPGRRPAVGGGRPAARRSCRASGSCRNGGGSRCRSPISRRRWSATSSSAATSPTCCDPVLDDLVSAGLLAAQRADHGRRPAARAAAAAPGDLGQSGPGAAMSRPALRDVAAADRRQREAALGEVARLRADARSCGCCSRSCSRPSSSCSSAATSSASGWGDFDTNANWARFFERLRPYVYLIIALLAFLAAAAVATVARYFRALRLPPPAPLPAAEQARRAGMDEADLLAARELANVVVHIAPDGTHRVEPTIGPP